MGRKTNSINKQIKLRLGEERLNNQGFLMKIIEYNAYNEVIVEFQDEYKLRAKTDYRHFKDGSVRNMLPRLGMENLNKQGCPMRIIIYNNNTDIVVEFQDRYKGRVHSSYQAFCNGEIKNPYHPEVCGVGMIGVRYPISKNGKQTKEYHTWRHMLTRCYDKKYKERQPTYRNVTCCQEWLLFESFYEWLHSQENFERWKNQERSALDKDILIKSNKTYSSETCCLVPMNINSLFSRKVKIKDGLPVGIRLINERYQVYCHNPFTNKQECLGTYSTIEEAFLAYKSYKENLIKQIAQIEFDKGNITEKCYNAMMNYQVEITD